MDIMDVKEVSVLNDSRKVNQMLESGQWVLLNVANGTYAEDGAAYCLFTLGRVAE